MENAIHSAATNPYENKKGDIAIARDAFLSDKGRLHSYFQYPMLFQLLVGKRWKGNKKKRERYIPVRWRVARAVKWEDYPWDARSKLARYWEPTNQYIQNSFPTNQDGEYFRQRFNLKGNGEEISKIQELRDMRKLKDGKIHPRNFLDAMQRFKAYKKKYTKRPKKQ